MAGIGIGAEYPVADSYLSECSRRLIEGAWPPGPTPAPSLLSGAGIPDAVTERSQRVRLRGLASPAGGRRSRRIGSSSRCAAAFPESPRWLAGVGRTDEAEAEMLAFRIRCGPGDGRYGARRRRRRDADDGRGRRRSRFRTVTAIAATAAFALPAAADHARRCFICSSPSATTDSARWRHWCWSAAATTSHRRCCSPRCRSSAIRSGR